jgi:hypothetical protein
VRDDSISKVVEYTSFAAENISKAIAVVTLDEDFDKDVVKNLSDSMFSINLILAKYIDYLDNLIDTIKEVE